MMHGPEKSDSVVVAGKPMNKAHQQRQDLSSLSRGDFNRSNDAKFGHDTCF
jgi:hypothetical protein